MRTVTANFLLSRFCIYVNFDIKMNKHAQHFVRGREWELEHTHYVYDFHVGWPSFFSIVYMI